MSAQGRLVYEVTWKLKLKGVSPAEQGRRQRMEVEARLDGWKEEQHFSTKIRKHLVSSGAEGPQLWLDA